MIITNKVKNLKTCDVDTFLSWDFNTLKDQKRDVTKLKNAIKKSGWSFPVIVWNNFVIDGAGRKKAVEELIAEGYTIPEIPYVEIEADSLQDAKAKALEVSSQFGEITKESFLEFTKDIDIDFDTFEIDGMTADAFIESDEQDDEVPETPEEPKSKLGDLYELGQHRVLCGDSTKLEDVERLMNGKRADMVFTDPPYGVNMSRSLVSGKDNSIKNDSIDGLDAILNDALTNANLVSKQNVPLYCWIGFRAYSIAEKVISNIWKINNCIVWKKPSIGLGGNGYRLQHELCIFSGNIEDKSQSDVWELKRDKSGLHPTMKPVELIEKAIILSSKIKEIVIDLFLGSGSTIIAAEKTGRICYGMELDPKYVDVIVQRYVDYVENPKVVKNGIDETNLWKKTPKKTE